MDDRATARGRAGQRRGIEQVGLDDLCALRRQPLSRIRPRAVPRTGMPSANSRSARWPAMKPVTPVRRTGCWLLQQAWKLDS